MDARQPGFVPASRADSSARLEHLLYTQGVTGSNPVPPMACVLLLLVLAGCPAAGPAGIKPDPVKSPVADAPRVPEYEEEPLAAGDVRVTTVRTEHGAFRFVLLDAVAPNTVKNFVKLARTGYYQNLLFHRVIPGTLIQGGDPKGDGTGGPGYTIKAEFSTRPHVPGAVAMARRPDPDSAGSQWYVCLAALPELDGKYTVFGQVFEGLDVCAAVQKGDRMLDVTIAHVKRELVPAEALR